ncbi:MAG: lipopolysaccharide kinase InaA family protein [Kiritimatiellae bacterium]|nr:lipopolysaccharide kinase InaA family protein [Kiritimatiellia bacterium]MDW8459195.1 serine/threonine-protein kinase [Verrucomicrobiota bacterium]
MNGGLQRFGPWIGQISPSFDTPVVRRRLEQFDEWLSKARQRRPGHAERIFLADLDIGDRTVPVVIRVGAPVSALVSWAAQAFGLSEARAFAAAMRLMPYGPAAPEPVAWLIRWEGSRIAARFLISRRIDPSTSLRDALDEAFRRPCDCDFVLAMLSAVSRTIRAMHDAGVQHRDLGNQNILLQQAAPDDWRAVVIDLGRARLFDRPLRIGERAADFGRLDLPGELFRILCEMYFASRPTKSFYRAVRIAHSLYQIRARTRWLRHPISHWRNRKKEAAHRLAPDPRDIWIWDEKTAQPVAAWSRRERMRWYPHSNFVAIGTTAIRLFPAAAKAFSDLASRAFGSRRRMESIWGIAVEPRPESWEEERQWLQQMPGLPVLIRVYRHKGQDHWRFVCEAGRRLAQDGFSVSYSLCQDRAAVRDPALWREMCDFVVDRSAEFAEALEIGHAINRVKWGLWHIREYAQLAAAAALSARRVPRLALMGPACIDFEFHQAAAFLKVLPEELRLDAFSHHLYVDRRGSPETRQLGFSTVEKFALARAVAAASGRCGERVVVSEVNWPLADAGEYSPVGCPYLYPGQSLGRPAVDENTYARYMLRYLLQAACSGLVDRVYWWRLVARGYGLVDDLSNPWRPRPAYFAWRRLLEMLEGAEFVRNIEVGKGAYLHQFRRRDGECVAVGYSWEGPRPLPASLHFRRAELWDGKLLEPSRPSLGEDPIYLRGVSMGSDAVDGG